MTLDYKGIGKRIRIARINADLTQERLSDLLDISPSHMSNIETGTTRLSLTTLVNLANALGVSPDDLLCDSVIHTRPQFEQDLQRVLDGCSNYEIRVIADVARSIVDAMRKNENLRVHGE